MTTNAYRYRGPLWGLTKFEFEVEDEEAEEGEVRTYVAGYRVYPAQNGGWDDPSWDEYPERDDYIYRADTMEPVEYASPEEEALIEKAAEAAMQQHYLDSKED